MAFHFSFDSVLRLRRGEQRQQELLLQRANEQVSRVVRDLEAIDLESREVAQEMKSAKIITGAEIQFGAERLRLLSTRARLAHNRLQQARERQSAVAEAFRLCWQKREVLEALYRRERDAFLLDESRGQQRRQDDAFLQRTRNRQILPSAPGKDCR